MFRAFILGIREFRLSATTSYDDPRLMDAYDVGRELAHVVTFRYFDESYHPPHP